MSVQTYNVSETAEANLQIEFQNDIKVAEITVTSLNGDPWDFSNKTAASGELKIYNKEGGAVLKTRPEHATSGLTFAANVIQWSDAWADIDLLLGDYYYDIFYEDLTLTNPTVKIVKGKLTVK